MYIFIAPHKYTCNFQKYICKTKLYFTHFLWCFSHVQVHQAEVWPITKKNWDKTGEYNVMLDLTARKYPKIVTKEKQVYMFRMFRCITMRSHQKQHFSWDIPVKYNLVLDLAISARKCASHFFCYKQITCRWLSEYFRKLFPLNFRGPLGAYQRAPYHFFLEGLVLNDLI